MEIVKVKVLKAHANSYGESYLKAVDGEYSLPADAAAMLAAQGLVTLPAASPKAARA